MCHLMLASPLAREILSVAQMMLSGSITVRGLAISGVADVQYEVRKGAFYWRFEASCHKILLHLTINALVGTLITLDVNVMAQRQSEYAAWTIKGSICDFLVQQVSQCVTAA